MEALFIVGPVFIVLACVFFVLLNDGKSSNQSRTHHTPTNNTTYTYRTMQPREETDCFFEKEMRDQSEKEAAADLLQYKFEKVDKALFKRDYEKAMTIFAEMMNETDPKRDAIARHFKILKVLEKLYMLREENPLVSDLCLQICEYDFQNMENFIAACNEEYGATSPRTRLRRPLCLVTPTKAAIIFEKRGDIMSAIKVCEMAIAWNAWDSGKKSFEERKSRLEKKLQKQMTEL